MLTTYSNKATITNAYPIALVRGFIYDMVQRGLTHKEIERKLYAKYSWRGNVKDLILQVQAENSNKKEVENYENKAIEPQDIATK